MDLGRPNKRGRGGCRQQLELDDVGEQEPVQKQSRLARYLISQWAWGFTLAAEVCRLCRLNYEDGSRHPDIVKLASLGTWGQHPQTCNRQLETWLHEPPCKQALSTITVHMKHTMAKVVEVDHLILLPHALFSVLYHNHKDAFLSRICGGSYENIKAFWEAMVDHPGLSGHPMLSRRDVDYKSQAIPIALHGDGVPVDGISRSWAKSCEIYSWSSMIGRGCTLLSNYLIYFFYSSLIVSTRGRSVREAFFKELVHSLYWAYMGLWPLRDPDGNNIPDEEGKPKPGSWLAGGYFLVLWGLLGDLEHMATVFGFPRHNARSPCACCQANSSDMPWTDCRNEGPVAARWLTAIFNKVSWLAARRERHIIFTVPGFSIVHWVPDWMHVKHLGTDLYFYASVLCFVVYHMLQGSTEDNLEMIWHLIVAAYQVRQACSIDREISILNGILCSSQCVHLDHHLLSVILLLAVGVFIWMTYSA